MLRVSAIFFSLVVGIHGRDLPGYINKCVLKYPEVFQCIKDEANRLIPELVKGDKELGIPSLSPLRVPRAEFHAPNFDLTLTDVFFDNYKDFKLTDVVFDLEKKNASLAFHADFLNATSNYTINDGKFLSRKISGKGRSDISLAGNTIRYKTNVEFTKINGQTYRRAIDPQVGLDVTRAYFYFEGLGSSENGIELTDTEEFIDTNWQALLDLLKPKLEAAILKSIQSVIEPVHARTPLEQFFKYE